MSRILLQALTDVADQAVVWPVAAAVAGALILLGWRRGALGWCLGVGAMLGTMLGLKLGFYACAPGWGSPSGHAASAAALAGGLWALCRPGQAGLQGPVAVAVLAGAVMGATRLALQVHAPLDVVLGTLVGAGCAALVAALAGPRPAAVRVRPVLLAALVAALVMHGRHLGAEAAISRAAQGQACPFR